MKTSDNNHSGKEPLDFQTHAEDRGAKSLTEILRSIDTTKPHERVIPMQVTVPMLTLRHNSLRNMSMDVCGVEIFFNSEGVGVTPSYNREYVVQYQNLRQGFITIVSDDTVQVDSDAEEEISVSAESVADEPVDGDDEIVSYEVVSSTPDETVFKPNKRRGRPSKP